MAVIEYDAPLSSLSNAELRLLAAAGRKDAQAVLSDEERALPKLKKRPAGGWGNPNHDGKTGKFTSNPGGSKAPKAKGIGTGKSKVEPKKTVAKDLKVEGSIKSRPGGITKDQYTAIDPRTSKGSIAARKALDATPEGRQLKETTDRWQDDVSEIVSIQKGFTAISTNPNARITPKQRADATAFMHGIKNAPVSPPVFRGARISPEEVAGYKKGKQIILPPSSFTSSQRIAGGFAKQASRREVVPVIMRVKNGSRAIPVEDYGKSEYKNEKEWISAGAFTVTNVTKRSDGVHIIDVDHTGVFQW